ncbi:DUF2000 domain-containing protein [Enterococcus faecalis]
MQKKKLVIIVDNSFPLGIIANTTAVIGMSLGAKYPNLIGESVMDASGFSHEGVVEIPIPILQGDKNKIFKIFNKAIHTEELSVIGFTTLGQKCKNYSEYVEKLSFEESEVLEYIGIGIAGDAKSINKLTGSLPLYR